MQKAKNLLEQLFMATRSQTEKFKIISIEDVVSFENATYDEFESKAFAIHGRLRFQKKIYDGRRLFALI